MKIDQRTRNSKIFEADRSLMDNATENPWIRPDCERDDPSYLYCYGQSFRGWAYAERNSFELGDLANSKLQYYEEHGVWKGDFVTLRCCLYFEWRRVHQCGYFGDDTLQPIRALFKALCAAYNDEAKFQPMEMKTGKAKMAIYDGVAFPNNVGPQLEEVLNFVKELQPCGIYRPAGVYKQGGHGMKHSALLASLNPTTGEWRKSS